MPTENILVFRLRQEWYALPVGHVREVLHVPSIVPLPKAPPSIRGVFQHRGRTLPVVDLAKHLGLPATEPGPETRIIIARLPKTLAGLLVDGVEEVLETDDHGFSKPIEGALRMPYIAGIANIKDRMTFLLDLPTLFSDEAGLVDPARTAGEGIS